MSPRAETSCAIAQHGAVNTAGEMGLGEQTPLTPQALKEYSDSFHFPQDWLRVMATGMLETGK